LARSTKIRSTGVGEHPYPSAGEGYAPTIGPYGSVHHETDLGVEGRFEQTLALLGGRFRSFWP
jgi:hypothetical protein